MSRVLIGIALFLTVGAVAHGQAAYRVFTSPKVPPRDALERMNLVIPWHTRIAVDTNRDGIASIQFVPDADKPVLVVQTLKGAVLLYDADKGDLLWKTFVGPAYWSSQPAAFNSRSIFVTRRNMLHVLNRADGSQRVFTFDPVLKQYTFGWAMSFAPNATLTADEDFLYVPAANRLHAILIPDFEAFEKARAFVEKLKREDKKDAVIPQELEKYLLDTEDSPQPDFYWGFAFPQLATSPPLISGEQLSVLTTDGTLTSVNRLGRGGRIEQFEFHTQGKVAGAAGQHKHIAYVGSDDFNLYAINMKSGELEWRHVSGAPIETKPEVNDRDVYISLKGVGLRRVDRISGREVWTNRDVKTFMAANHHYVYARDQNGALYVLDQRRGSTLAKVEMADWKNAVSNEWNDRFYLAANDGQLICLRHKDLAKQLVMKLAEPAKPKEPPMPIEEKKKEEEKKEEKKDDKDKDKAAKVGRVVAPPLPNVAPAQPVLGQRDDADRDDRRRVGP